MPDTSGDGLAPGTVVGRCVVIREIGRGGMGAVYLAKHQTLGVDVALKVLPAHIARASPDFAERFLREARVAAALRHPNVVAMMDADRDPGTGLHYIVEEYVDGGTLGSRLKKGPLAEKQALAAIAPVLKALEEARRQKIVHRDIKPDNILVTKDGKIKLGDLGLAKRSGESQAGLTQAASAMGTPAYMSPEQIEDTSGVDHRSDLYSLGATLFHLLTGSPPYTGTEVIAILHKVMSAPIPDPRSRRPEISAGTAAICMKMLAKRPGERYQTAAEVLADMQKGGPALELLPEIAAAPAAAAAAGPAGGFPGATRTVDVAALTPTSGPGVPNAQKALYVIAGCAVLLLLLALRLTLKSSPVPDTGGGTAADRTLNTGSPGGTGGGGAVPPDRGTHPPPDRVPVNPVPDRVPPPPPVVASTFTLHEGCRLALTFEADTEVEHEGHRGWRDTSGNMIVAIAVSTKAGAGRVGAGAAFDGDSSYLSLPGFSQKTVAAWVRPAAARAMVWYDGGGEERGTGFQIGVGRIGRPAAGDIEGVFLSFIHITALAPAEGVLSGWHHIAVRWDGDRGVTIAVDGVIGDGSAVDRRGPRRPSDRLPHPGPQPITLGEKPAPGSEFLAIGRPKAPRMPEFGAFAGEIDDLAIWDRALTDAELTSLAGFAAAGRSYCAEIESEVSK
ncbi:MAG: protein kinase [Candidatus Brocadiae bacterium]|nr:protein kinase [Candidatus Brocadiia bacterium]